MQLKQTYILKGKTEYFYEKLAQIPPIEIPEFMRKNLVDCQFDCPFRDKVEYNLARQNGKNITYSTELGKRKGYNLFTLHIQF